MERMIREIRRNLVNEEFCISEIADNLGINELTNCTKCFNSGTGLFQKVSEKRLVIRHRMKYELE
ncbi:hypothetical protein [Chryseobacterium vrystaatense]|uniref:hypothetical protein n=1 Tax=Chryseobacterium vrystaatense TaxID=307480 RepID=UPI0009336EEC|nr:hypothetical protein [Chryseobacterium vrystaatense]